MDDNIINYYASVDKNILNDMCKNSKLKNLISLSTLTNINVLNKSNKLWKLKSTDKMLLECEKLRKKELKQSSSSLSNLAKIYSNNKSENVKYIYKDLETKLDNINKFVDCLYDIKNETIVSDVYQNTQKKYIKVFPEDSSIEKKKLITIDLKIDNILNIESSDDYVECYSNC